MATGPSSEQVLAALNDFLDPETGRGVNAEQQARDIRVGNGRLELTLALSTHSAPLRQKTVAACAEHLKARLPGVTEVKVNLVVHPRPAEAAGQVGLKAKSVIAVGSGKGGVGKSTLAASLAWALKRAGCRVGLMDADIYGPSIPHLLGLEHQPQLDDNRKIRPADVEGMKVMSIGFMVPAGKAVALRGPMLHGIITQFLRDTDWGELDYLIIDMPPGTGDIAITLSQLLPLTGAVVVCTPQDVALIDAVRAISMFRTVNIPVLGMIENMSYFLCPDNGKRYDIFGHGGAMKQATELDVPFLGELPINIQVRINGDEGRLAANFSNADVAPLLESICTNLAEQVAANRRQQGTPLPTLSVV
ncbi:MAG: Mrp/NBP35 family ATP-binding protein [Planctomycetes bacterium]|nr:Mrp/NBP35 family ATP-binding protein [Planctomycetota bacterium]